MPFSTQGLPLNLGGKEHFRGAGKTLGPLFDLEGGYRVGAPRKGFYGKPPRALGSVILRGFSLPPGNDRTQTNRFFPKKVQKGFLGSAKLYKGFCRF